MSADHPTPPLKHVLATAREYLTHWFTAGAILTLTGFTPDHWVERLFHGLKLDGLRDALPAIDYRLLVVGLGVIVSTVAVILQIRRMQKQQLAALASVPSVAVAPIPAAPPAIEASDDIAGKPSIAVLPFVNMSDDKSQEYFADGMTEDIITGLSCDSRLFVIARNSTFAYKGQSPDIRTLGKELGVRYVLEGSIRPMGDHLRITVQLIETTSGAHVWADKIDRPKAELFSIMDEVVDGLVMALCSNLGVAESKRAKRQRPEDLQAWALCAQAEALHLDSQALLEAEKLARRATEIEPGYAVGWALLGFMSCMRIVWGLSADLAKDSEETLSLVKQALRLAPNDPVVLGYCGFAANWTGQAAQAVDYLERSLAINPNNSFARFAYGSALMNNARPADGVAQLQLFIRRSPKDPYVGLAYFFLAFCYLTLGEFQQAEQSAHECIKHLPGFAWGCVALAMSLGALGRDAEAQQQIAKIRELEPGLTREHFEIYWHHVLRDQGQAETWIALLHQAWRD